MKELGSETSNPSEAEIEAEFRAFHTTASLEERKGYLIARHHQIAHGEPTWVRRSGDSEDEGAVFDYYVDGRRVGFVDEYQEGECYVYKLSQDGVPEPYDSIPRPLGQAVGLLEVQDYN